MAIMHWPIALGSSVAVAVLTLAWQVSQDETAPSKPAAGIAISTETTWVTEPLRADGLVDYFEVVNRHHSRGVTSENNAVVLLYEALGPSPEGGRQQPDRFFVLLGMERSSNVSKYYQQIGEWLDQRPDAPADRQLVSDMYAKAMDRPWTADEFPLIAAWLEDNESALQLVTAASERPRYFSPLVPNGGEDDQCLFMVSLPAVQKSRDLARALRARAMRELGEGSQVDAWRDMMALHRLGRLLEQGPTLVEWLVGIALESFAVDCELHFLSETQPSVKLLGIYRRQLDQLPPRPPVAGKLDVFERASCLDALQRIAIGKMPVQDVVGAGDWRENLTLEMAVQWADWNEILAAANCRFDKHVAATRIADLREQSLALRQLEGPLRDALAAPHRKVTMADVLRGNEGLTKALSDALLDGLTTTTSAMVNADKRTTQWTHHVVLAVALAAWRAEHGTYPESLVELAPQYLATVPIDHYSRQPLKYSRTADGYRFYSIGENEIDDMGHTDNDEPRGDDLVVRMPYPFPER